MSNELYQHRVQYYETDQMKVVHHSNYIRWFEEARTHFLGNSGFSYHWMEENGIIIPVLSAAAEYKAMVRFGEVVEIALKVEEFNGVKLAISYEVRNAETKELKTTGSTSHCFLDADYRPLRLKKAFPEVYEMFMRELEKSKQA